MHKEELITLHQMLFNIKDYFESINPDLKFTQYYSLKIQPNQTHKSKMEHKYAIFVLGNELANAMKDVEFLSIRQDICTNEGTGRKNIKGNGIFPVIVDTSFFNTTDHFLKRKRIFKTGIYSGINTLTGVVL